MLTILRRPFAWFSRTMLWHLVLGHKVSRVEFAPRWRELRCSCGHRWKDWS